MNDRVGLGARKQGRERLSRNRRIQRKKVGVSE